MGEIDAKSFLQGPVQGRPIAYLYKCGMRGICLRTNIGGSIAHHLMKLSRWFGRATSERLPMPPPAVDKTTGGSWLEWRPPQLQVWTLEEPAAKRRSIWRRSPISGRPDLLRRTDQEQSGGHGRWR